MPDHKSLITGIYNNNQTNNDGFARILFLLLVLNSVISQPPGCWDYTCVPPGQTSCVQAYRSEILEGREAFPHMSVSWLQPALRSLEINASLGLHYSFTWFWDLPNQHHRVSAHSGIISVTCYIHENCCFMYQNFISLCYWTVFYCVTRSIILYPYSW